MWPLRAVQGNTRSQIGLYLRSWHLLLMVTRAALAATRVFFCPDSGLPRHTTGR
jgi:hypothetical protein